MILKNRQEYKEKNNKAIKELVYKKEHIWAQPKRVEFTLHKLLHNNKNIRSAAIPTITPEGIVYVYFYYSNSSSVFSFSLSSKYNDLESNILFEIVKKDVIEIVDYINLTLNTKDVSECGR